MKLVLYDDTDLTPEEEALLEKEFIRLYDEAERKRKLFWRRKLSVGMEF